MAGTEVGSLYYDLNIDDKNLKNQLDSADKSVKSLGDRVSKYWGDSVSASQKFMLGTAAAGAAAVAFGVSSVKAFQESQAAITQLDAVLQSTGGSAGVTKDSAIALSRELQRTTTISDETALAAENMALTFTSIGKDIFPGAVKAAVDMATSLNGGLTPSADQVRQRMVLIGKALQDPDAGLGALKKVGVNVDELAKKFVGVSDIATKQKMILQELGTEFGGSAAAQTKTFAGRIEMLKNNFNDLQEQVGETIMQALAPVMDWFGRVTDKITEQGGILVVLKKFYEENKGAIKAVAGAILGALVPAVVALALAFANMMITLAPFMLIGAALFFLWDKNRLLFWALVGALVGLATAIAIALIPSVIAATSAFGAMAVAVIAATWPFVLAGIAIAAAAYLIVTHWETVKNFFVGIWHWVQDNWPLLLGILLGPFALAVVYIAQHFKAIKDTIVNAVKGVGSWLYNAGKDLIQGLINGITDKFRDLSGAVKGVVTGSINSVKSLLGIHSPSTVFMGIGRNVTEGFVKGIQDSADMAAMAMSGLGNNVIAPAISSAGAANNGGVNNTTTQNHGDINVNIGSIQDRADADYLLNQLDRMSQLESMGLSPARQVKPA